MRNFLLAIIIVFLVSCSTDDTPEINNLAQDYELVFTTGDVPEFIAVTVEAKIYYGETYFVEQVSYNSTTNTSTVVTQVGPTKIEADLYISDGSTVNMILYDSGGNIVDEQISTTQNYQYIYEF